MYIKSVDHFHSSLSKLQILTDVVLDNCVEMKYFTLFNAYNINDLSVGVQEKTAYKTKINELKTIFFSNFNKMEKHLLSVYIQIN